MRNVSKWACAIALPLTVVVAACSSSNEPSADQKQIGEIEEAFGEASCISAPADATFVGKITEYDSPATYSNSKCYKSVVVSVTNIASNLQDIVITDVNIGTPAAPPTPPSDPGGIIDPTKHPPRVVGGQFHPWTPPQTQAECEALGLAANLYLTSGAADYTAHRGANGQWVTGTNGSYCQVPKVVFGGATWRAGDFDKLVPGSSYTITATYRGANTSHAATLPLKIYTPAITCGEPGLPCCTVNQGSNRNWCSEYGPLTCFVTTTGSVGTCQPCGKKNEACCDGSSCEQGQLCFPSGYCAPACGREGDTCCQGNSCWPYNGTTCQSGKCLKPVQPPVTQPPITQPPVTQPPVTQPPGCGGMGQACCNGQCTWDQPLLCQSIIAGGAPRCVTASTMCGAPSQPCCNDSGRDSLGTCDDQQWPTNACDGFHCHQAKK